MISKKDVLMFFMDIIVIGLITIPVLILTIPLHELGHVIIFKIRGYTIDEIKWLQYPSDGIFTGTLGYVKANNNYETEQQRYVSLMLNGILYEMVWNTIPILISTLLYFKLLKPIIRVKIEKVVGM